MMIDCRGNGTPNQRGTPAAGNYEGNRASAFELYKKPELMGGMGLSPAYKRTLMTDIDDEYAK